MPRKLAGHLAGLIFTAIAGALFAATLVRLAPGADSDEHDFDPRFSQSSIAALHQARDADRSLPRYYMKYLGGLAHGDFGTSYSLKRPVSELIADRGPATLKLTGVGLAAGWTFGFTLALAAVRFKNGVGWAASAASSLLLCLPVALTALLILFVRAPWWWAISLAVIPKIYTYSRAMLEKIEHEPHVLLARAQGLGRGRILFRHVLPPILPELFALAGISVSLAFSAAIPIEAISDVPGVGQLAWQAALGRDLPILVTVTLLLALITRAANAAADIAISALPSGAAR